MQSLKEQNQKSLADAARAPPCRFPPSLALRNNPRFKETRQRVLKAADGRVIRPRATIPAGLLFSARCRSAWLALAGADSMDRIYNVPFHAAAREAGQHLLLSLAGGRFRRRYADAPGIVGVRRFLMGSRRTNTTFSKARLSFVLGDHRIRAVMPSTFPGWPRVVSISRLGHRRIASFRKIWFSIVRNTGYREMKALGLNSTRRGSDRMKSTPTSSDRFL